MKPEHITVNRHHYRYKEIIIQNYVFKAVAVETIGHRSKEAKELLDTIGKIMKNMMEIDAGSSCETNNFIVKKKKKRGQYNG